MSSLNYPKTFLLLGVIIYSGLLHGQQLLYSNLANAHLQHEYEKVYLDGQVSYKHVPTNTFISLKEYNALGIIAPLEESANINESNWNTDRVNAYKNVKTPVPFSIKFDQSHFTPPISDKMVVTSRFGRRRRGPHRGIDVDLVTGDKVVSILPGKVRFVGYSSGHGKTVVVRHANEVETVYAHLSSYKVEENDIVEEGQVLGKGGKTGNARGSHLHFEIRYRGICIHPEYLLNFDGSNEIRGAELWVTSGWKNPHRHSSYRKSTMNLLTTEDEAIAYQIQEPKYHRVKRGDTLYHIARTYNMRLSDICSLNSIKSSTVLKIGKTLQVR